MITIAWLILLAALLPLFAAAASKFRGKGFDNNNPRMWLASQEGWRARANAAQQNLLEGLPFFFAAVLFAIYSQADYGRLATLMAVWLLLRLAYLLIYLADYATIRSIVWVISLATNIAILTAGNFNQ